MTVKPERAAADLSKKAAWPALFVAGFSLAAGMALFAVDHQVAGLVTLTITSTATLVGFLVHARARPGRKGIGHKLSLGLSGVVLFVVAGILGRQSFQLEGFFFYTFAGVMGGVVTHYLVAKIVGPLLVGRVFCGWGCWIWTVLDYLPWKRSSGRRPRLGHLRTVHFVASAGLVAALTFGLGYQHGFDQTSVPALWWFLGGCAFYYAAGIALAAVFKDNRAFCKILCPITVFLRAGNRLALLKVAGDRGKCDRCGACEKICPMDVRVLAFVDAGKRVLDPECTLCQSCIGACTRGSLRLGLGLDVSRGDAPPRAETTEEGAKPVV
jgi:ferredoxin-type protein NapH